MILFITQRPMENNFVNFSAVIGVRRTARMKSTFLMLSLCPKNNSCLPGDLYINRVLFSHLPALQLLLVLLTFSNYLLW